MASAWTEVVVCGKPGDSARFTPCAVAFGTPGERWRLLLSFESLQGVPGDNARRARGLWRVVLEPEPPGGKGPAEPSPSGREIGSGKRRGSVAV